MSGCSSGSFVIEAPSLASPLWGETRSRTAFAVKTGTRELIVPASLLRRTCVRLDSGRMPNHLLDQVTQPRANSTKIAALHSFAALASRVPKSFRRGPPSEQGGSADDPAGATWHARRSGISNGLGECTDARDDSDRDGTECVRALRGAGAATCGVNPRRSRGRSAGDRLARVRGSSLHSLKEPEECASPN